MRYHSEIKEMKYWYILQLDEPCKHYAKWKTSITEDHTVWLHLYETVQRQPTERSLGEGVEAAGRWAADPGPFVPAHVVGHKNTCLTHRYVMSRTLLYITVSISKIDVLLPHQKKRKREKELRQHRQLPTGSEFELHQSPLQETNEVGQHLFFWWICATERVQLQVL